MYVCMYVSSICLADSWKFGHHRLVAPPEVATVQDFLQTTDSRSSGLPNVYTV